MIEFEIVGKLVVFQQDGSFSSCRPATDVEISLWETVVAQREQLTGETRDSTA